MSGLIQLSPAILKLISKQLSLPLAGSLATIKLLDEGGTVPFIARYRKEQTGNLDEVAIDAIAERLTYFRELEDRRATVLRSIEEQGKLTDDLRAQINGVTDKSELEDLYLPYKPKRRTKATIAREKGLEPLADYLWKQLAQQLTVAAYAATFIDFDKGVNSTAEALDGAGHIIAERINETAEFRAHLRQLFLTEGVVTSRLIQGSHDPDGKFAMYADYSEPASKIPSHRMLAIRRGANEEILNFSIDLDAEKPLRYLRTKVIQRDGDWVPYLEAFVEDAWKRLMNVSIQTDVRLELKQRSDTEAIRVFRDNLQNLLLSPPAGMISVLAVDPGLRTGCKLAVVDDTGKFLAHDVMYPLEPKNDTAGASAKLDLLIKAHNIRAIAIGNGTGSREASAFIQQFVQERALANVFSVVVNESGASIYSASEIARQECPDLDLTVRGAISIGRRLQDPLAELVKIDPKSIGVGQYQHDVDQNKLHQALEATVETCVNRVGVDLNTASHALLRHVAGINDRTAQKIVEYRDSKGRFRSRVDLRSVPGFGPKTFEQAAGFLRIRGGENPLDMTAVHPESYRVVEKMAGSLQVSVNELVSKPALVENLKLEGFANESAGLYTLRDIIQELRKPGRDPRDHFVVPQFKAGVTRIADLEPGMVLEGAVTNVTNFGAFVDVGVHQDGLVHISELSNRFIKDPHEAVKVGQVVKVRVMSADPKTKRIALSIKALLPSDDLPRVKNAPPQPRPAVQKPIAKTPTMEDKLNQLSDRFRRR